MKLCALFCIGFISIFSLKIFFAFGLQKAFMRNLKFLYEKSECKSKTTQAGETGSTSLNESMANLKRQRENF